MRVVFTADVQLHPHELWSKILPNGINSRLQNGLDALEQAFKLAEGGTLVINGDLFHDRKTIPIEVLDAVSTIFVRHSNVRVILNVGNHDQYLRDGRIHSTQIFKGFSNVTVVSSPGLVEHRDIGLNLFVHPFTTDLEEFRKWSHSLKFDSSQFNVIVAHQAVEGSLLAKNTRSKGGLTLGDLRYKDVDAVILGHYHRPQALADNVWYIGSPYEVDEGEAGDEKRFITLDTDGWVWDSVPVEGMPKHRRWLSSEEFKKSGSAGDFNIVACTSRDEAEAISTIDGCKSVMSDVTTTAEGVAVGDVSIEEAVKLSLQSYSRPDLWDKKVKQRLGL